MVYISRLCLVEYVYTLEYPGATPDFSDRTRIDIQRITRVPPQCVPGYLQSINSIVPSIHTDATVGRGVQLHFLGASPLRSSVPFLTQRPIFEKQLKCHRDEQSHGISTDT